MASDAGNQLVADAGEPAFKEACSGDQQEVRVAALRGMAARSAGRQPIAVDHDDPNEPIGGRGSRTSHVCVRTGGNRHSTRSRYTGTDILSPWRLRPTPATSSGWHADRPDSPRPNSPSEPVPPSGSFGLRIRPSIALGRHALPDLGAAGLELRMRLATPDTHAAALTTAETLLPAEQLFAQRGREHARLARHRTSA